MVRPIGSCTCGWLWWSVLVLSVLSVSVVKVAGSSDESTTQSNRAPNPSTYLTVNDCESEIVPKRSFQDWLKTPADCYCPPGYTVVVPSQHDHDRPLCAALHEAGPYEDGCVESGTSTDYYSLDRGALEQVRQFLSNNSVAEWWISARRLVRYGGLARRLPGEQWNEPLEKVMKKSHLLLPPVEDSTLGHDCASVRMEQPDQITFRNCSAALVLLCLYREQTILRLHCNEQEYTTRYSTLQHYCFRVTKDRRANDTGSDSYYINSNRKQQLLIELRNISRDCRNVTNIISAVQPFDPRRTARRGQNTSSSSSSSSETESLLPLAATTNSIVCVAQQHRRLQPNVSLDKADGTGPGIYLYFDKSRHKLIATVYGKHLFWRADPSDVGFVCFTNIDDERLDRRKVQKLRVSRAKWELGKNRTMYEISLERDGPPRLYWCEAHLVPNFARITSEPVLAQRKTDCRRYFAATVELMSEREPDRLRLKDYDSHISQLRKERRHPELSPIFDTIKSMQVKRVENVWTAANSGWYTVRLLLHVVMKCDKRWEQQLAMLEADDPNEIGKTQDFIHFVLT